MAPMDVWSRAHTRSVAVLWCFALLRCGGESTAPAPRLPPDPDRPPNDTEIELAAVMCRYATRCDPDGLHAFSGGSEQACRDYFACSAARGDLAPLRRGVDLEVCMQALDSGDCPDLERYPYQRLRGDLGVSFPWARECDEYGFVEAYAAAPPTGSACITGLDERPRCREHDYCAAESVPSFGWVFCGTCTPRIALGDACTDSDRCVADATCVDGVCALLRELGEACTSPRECRFRSCTDAVCARPEHAPEPYADVVNRDCAAIPGFEDCGDQIGLTCIDGKCRPLPDEGESCTIRCRAGQGCIGGQCVSVGCAIDLGERCDSWCTGGECVDGICSPLPARVGAECRLFCAPGLECERERCVLGPDRSNGTSCDSDFDCESSFCDRDLSESCSRDGSCSAPPCDRCGTCKPPPVASDCR
jgi:hypothetical protein